MPWNPSGRKRAVVYEGRTTGGAALFENRDPNRLLSGTFESSLRTGDEEGGNIATVQIEDPSGAGQDTRTAHSLCNLGGRPRDRQSSCDLRTERHDAPFAQPSLKDAIMALIVLAVMANALTSTRCIMGCPVSRLTVVFSRSRGAKRNAGRLQRVVRQGLNLRHPMYGSQDSYRGKNWT